MSLYECVPIARNDVTQQQVDGILDGIASQLETRHIGGMATYAISSGTGRGFDIKIVGDDGVRQTMLGFPTRQAAEAWIVEDQRRSQEEPRAASGLGDERRHDGQKTATLTSSSTTR